MERAFSKNKDADRIILQHLDDRDLLQLILVNKYAYSLTDENFWRNRLVSKYPSTVEFKRDQTWKHYYLSVVYYVDKLKNKYNYSYIKGDPKNIYDIFNKMEGVPIFSKIQEFYKHGYEDISLILINKIRKEFGYHEFKLNTAEYDEYKTRYLV